MHSLDELNEQLKRVSTQFNNTPQPQFKRYSPNQMRYIIYDPFNSKSALKIMEISEQDLKSIPFFMQSLYILEKLEKYKEVKLTAKEFLPTAWVADIYRNGYMKNKWIEKRIDKLYKEMDSMEVFIPRIILGIAGLTKKRKGKLSITAKGRKLIQNKNDLLKILFQTYTQRFNWAYLDAYGDHQLGQLGFAFSLILMSKYGKKWKKDDHYAYLYESAFPMMKEITETEHDMDDRQFNRCYSIRSFERFMLLFGLIEMKGGDHFREDIYVRKTVLFDKLIKIRKPNSFSID